MTAVNEIDVVPVSERTINGLHRALGVVARERKYLALTDAPPLAVMAAFSAMLARNGAPQLVALDGKQVIGWADLRPHDEGLARHVGVLGMGLLPDYRGRGIGRRLLDELLRRSPFERVELSVFADNTAAIALYEKAGFVRECVKRRAVKLDGYKDLVLMAVSATATSPAGG
jgi:ribosomal protein S18 acetylase RimI-like enzyme